MRLQPDCYYATQVTINDNIAENINTITLDLHLEPITPTPRNYLKCLNGVQVSQFQPNTLMQTGQLSEFSEVGRVASSLRLPPPGILKDEI